MRLIFTLLLLSGSSAYGLISKAADVASETTQLAFKLQDLDNHAETLDEWSRNFDKLTEQLDTMVDQLDVQTLVKDWMGNPIEVELPSIEILSIDDFLNDLNYGIPWDSIIAETDGTDSLQETHDGLYIEVEPTTVVGETVEVSDEELKKFAVVDQQYSNYVETSLAIDERLLELQENQALTLAELQEAETDAEVQKLSAIVNAQNGQIALLISEREKQYQHYLALKQLNENQEEKAKAVSVKAQLKDQNMAYDSLQNYLGSLTSTE
ncbi:MAG: hypothetical protein KJT03_03645 [Verrucomicrobiae bacterium]|nr:hypothetical protein [Verrucomicrobiae bacterium]